MLVRIIVLSVLCVVAPRIGYAQSVELLYTPAVLNDVLALKESLKVPLVHASSALSLVGASAEKKKSFGEKAGGAAIVVIVGEDALKAAADVPFAVPVILVNAAGPTAATNKIIRVFDAANAPAGAIPISGSGTVNLNAGREVALKGQPSAIVPGVIAGFK